MTYSIPDTVGPTQYPKAFQALNSYCAARVRRRDAVHRGGAVHVHQPLHEQ